MPLVRHHCLWLYGRLRRVCPDLPPPLSPSYYFQPTYDIDLPWAYHHRGWKGVASGAKDIVTGKFRRALSRISTSKTTDPFNNLTRLAELHRPTESAVSVTTPPGASSSDNSQRGKPIIFWLLADNTDHRDINPYPIPSEQIDLMLAVDDRAVQGIHPGYLTMEDATVLREEVNRYDRIMGRPPTISRQHFLRLRLPESYRNLHRAGVRADYTMGYAGAIGWRAGTNLPFTWYDVEREEATYFKVHPFAAMDVTLKNYLGLSPRRAMTEILALARPIRDLGGPFSLLWHNSSFAVEYGWEGWGEMYCELVEELRGAT